MSEKIKINIKNITLSKKGNKRIVLADLVKAMDGTIEMVGIDLRDSLEKYRINNPEESIQIMAKMLAVKE